MPRKGSGRRSATSIARSERMTIPGLRDGTNANDISESSRRSIRAESSRRATKNYQDTNKHNKASESRSMSSSSRTNPRSVQSSLSCLSQGESSVTATTTRTYSRSGYMDQPSSRHSESIRSRDTASVKRKGKDNGSSHKLNLLTNATDSLELTRKSLKSKNYSEAFTSNRLNAEILRCEQRRSPTKDSQRSSSRAVVKKPPSMSTLTSEKSGQSSNTSLGSGKYPIEGKACACLCFKADMAGPANAKITKGGKKEKLDTNDGKQNMDKKSVKNMKEDRKKCGKRSEESWTKHHCKHQKFKVRDADL